MNTPLNLAFGLLKHATSPQALAHKVAYDTEYESNPKRVKYREELNQERRKRGIYGTGGPDMSHTKDLTLVAENPHTNRARHFKERGTLKSVLVTKNMRDFHNRYHPNTPEELDEKMEWVKEMKTQARQKFLDKFGLTPEGEIRPQVSDVQPDTMSTIEETKPVLVSDKTKEVPSDV
jgi:hypothetical protein